MQNQPKEPKKLKTKYAVEKSNTGKFRVVKYTYYDDIMNNKPIQIFTARKKVAKNLYHYQAEELKRKLENNS